MLAAWRRPPANDRPLRPWLAQVLRNIADKWRRGERRRAGREQAAHARSRVTPSAAEIAESSETLRVLVDELQLLDPPLREVVTLRHMRGMTSAEIARRLGVPAGTVRWRLREGLERMRGRLDRRHGDDRTRWCGLLIAVLSPVDGMAAGRSGAGELVRWLVRPQRWAAVVAVGLVWVVFEIVRDRATPTLAEIGAVGSPSDATGATIAAGSGRADPAAVAPNAAPRQSVGVPPADDVLPLERGQAGVVARIVDRAGAPVDGAGRWCTDPTAVG